jgi:hypothetical protein
MPEAAFFPHLPIAHKEWRAAKRKKRYYFSRLILQLE